MSGTSSTTPPLDGVDTSLTPEQRKAYAEIGAALEARIPFRPETWPEDADGDRPSLCTECGTPVRYGSRHVRCGEI